MHAVDTLLDVDTAAQMSMISQSFIHSLKPTVTVARQHIRIRNAEHGSYMRCRIIRQLPITIQGKQFQIDIAVGPITDNFIIGLDFLLEHQCIKKGSSRKAVAVAIMGSELRLRNAPLCYPITGPTLWWSCLTQHTLHT